MKIELKSRQRQRQRLACLPACLPACSAYIWFVSYTQHHYEYVKTPYPFKDSTSFINGFEAFLSGCTCISFTIKICHNTQVMSMEIMVVLCCKCRIRNFNRIVNYLYLSGQGVLHVYVYEGRGQILHMWGEGAGLTCGGGGGCELTTHMYSFQQRNPKNCAFLDLEVCIAEEARYHQYRFS